MFKSVTPGLDSMPSKQIFERVKIAPARNTFVNRTVHSLTHEAPHSLLYGASRETRIATHKG